MHGTTAAGSGGEKTYLNSSLVYDRKRKHLSTLEIQRLIGAAQGWRNEARDYCFFLLMFRRGRCVSEACRLKLDQADSDNYVKGNFLCGSLATDSAPLRCG
jgi:integrase